MQMWNLGGFLPLAVIVALRGQRLEKFSSTKYYGN